MRILIRTLPLTQGNYGGTLQAYALQRVLRDMGHDVYTDTPVRLHSNPGAAYWQLRETARHRSNDGVPSFRMMREVNEEIASFVDEYIKHTRVLSGRRWPSGRGDLGSYDAVIVGSDQVWRPAYSDVRINFLAETEGIPLLRLSYAASFGTDSLAEYNPELLAECSRLLRSFDGVSVRESSGVDLCRAMGVDATQHVDPTFLVSRDEWLSMTGETQVGPGGVTAMFLDADVSRDDAIRGLADSMGAEYTSFYPPALRSRNEYRAAPHKYRRARPEAWLRAIASSRLVVTDSFHVCAFAIILNVPFVALGNEGRGQARFVSLLSKFGLSSRLASREGGLAPRVLQTEIDWEPVNAIIERERNLSLSFLARALGQPRSRQGLGGADAG